jgi:hypothetical protein
MAVAFQYKPLACRFCKSTLRLTQACSEGCYLTATLFAVLDERLRDDAYGMEENQSALRDSSTGRKVRRHSQDRRHGSDA